VLLRKIRKTFGTQEISVAVQMMIMGDDKKFKVSAPLTLKSSMILT
jgi:hypothetical protein